MQGASKMLYWGNIAIIALLLFMTIAMVLIAFVASGGMI
jgi:hypothetical protein